MITYIYIYIETWLQPAAGSSSSGTRWRWRRSGLAYRYDKVHCSIYMSYSIVHYDMV